MWEKWLPLAEWWYKTSYHNASKMTPYEVVYGQPPPMLLPYTPHSSQIQAVDMVLRKRDHILHILQENLHMERNRMKQQADQHHSEHTFQFDDMFFLLILTSNPPRNSKGLKSWLQISMGHIRFFRRLGLLLINWNFLLLHQFTQYFMSLVSRK